MDIFENYSAALAILLCTVVIYYYLYFRWHVATYWSKRGVPHMQPNFLIGNAWSIGIKKSLMEFTEELYNKNKDKRICGFWIFHKPVLAVLDPEIIKNVLVRDFSSFINRVTMDVGEHDPLIKDNLFNMIGHDWRNMRVKMTPTFTSGKMKMMFPTMIETGRVLQDYLKKEVGKELDMREICARFTTNVIASIAFGIEVNALENPNVDFRIYGRRVFEPTLTQILLNIFASSFPRLGKLFKISQLPRILTKFFVSTVKDTIDYRKANNVYRKDFMQLLIELIEKGKIDDVDRDADQSVSQDVTKNTKFTVNEAAAQAFLFFSAGFETSSVTMTHALFEIARTPEVQNRLKKEIKNAYSVGGGELTYEALNKLEYLDWVIQETLRLYPAVPLLMREADNDYHIKDINVIVPKGTMIIIPSCGLVHDPEYYTDPFKFDPERHSPGEKQKLKPYTHMPFGEGPRSCIGNRFGILQTKVGLFSILNKFTITTSNATPENIEYKIKSFTPNITGGMPLKIVADD